MIIQRSFSASSTLSLTDLWNDQGFSLPYELKPELDSSFESSLEPESVIDHELRCDSRREVGLEIRSTSSSEDEGLHQREKPSNSQHCTTYRKLLQERPAVRPCLVQPLSVVPMSLSMIDSNATAYMTSYLDEAEEQEQVDPDWLPNEEVDVEKIENGMEKRTCVMLRNIPNKYDYESLLSLLRDIVGGRKGGGVASRWFIQATIASWCENWTKSWILLSVLSLC